MRCFVHDFFPKSQQKRQNFDILAQTLILGKDGILEIRDKYKGFKKRNL